MFEEFYVNAGTILIPTGEYNSMDGTGAAYDELPVVYFSRDKSHRDSNDVLQLERIFMCKPAPGTELPESIPGNSRFRDKDGNLHDISISERLFDHFDQVLEAYRLTTAGGGIRNGRF